GPCAVDRRKPVARRSGPARPDARQDARAARPPRRDRGEVTAVSSAHSPRRALVFLSGLVPVLLTMALVVFRPAFLARLDDSAYDIVMRSARTRGPSQRVAIVAVDDRSLSSIGQWPSRRDVVGRLI